MSDGIVPKDSSVRAEVAKHLIDRFFGSLGWVFTHDTPKRIAVKNYIAEIEKCNYPPLHKAALISRANRDIKEYANQLGIVNGSVVYLEPTAKPENLEDDWLAQFFDKTRLVSNEEFQEIWSRLLAEECNNPGSIPKSLLFILEKMDRKEAEDFMKICSVTVSAFAESAPLLRIISNETLCEFGLSLDSLIQLESIGLLKMEGGFSPGYALIHDGNNTGEQSVRYFGKSMKLPDKMNSFPIGQVLFTKDGYALWKVVAATEIDGFWEKTVVPLIKNSIEAFQREQEKR